MEIPKQNKFIPEPCEDVHNFIKLSYKGDSSENSIFKKVFFPENNRQELNLVLKGSPLRSFKSDYIFNEYENTILVFCKIKPQIVESLNAGKNLSFFTFGEERLGKSSFFFGKNKKFTSDSIFKYSFDIAYQNISDYDFIVFDIILVNKEKFLLDYRNVTFDPKYEMIDYLNQIFSEINHDGHLILIIKFLRNCSSLTDRSPNSNKNV